MRAFTHVMAALAAVIVGGALFFDDRSAAYEHVTLALAVAIMLVTLAMRKGLIAAGSATAAAILTQRIGGLAMLIPGVLSLAAAGSALRAPRKAKLARWLAPVSTTLLALVILVGFVDPFIWFAVPALAPIVIWSNLTPHGKPEAAARRLH